MTVDKPAVRKIDLPTSFPPMTPGDRVIKAADLMAEQLRAVSIDNAQRDAAQIIAEARLEAALLKSQAMEAFEAEAEAHREQAAAELRGHLQHATDMLGRVVASTVEAIFRALFRSDPSAAVEAITHIAHRLLAEEVPNAVIAHPADLAMVAQRFASDTKLIEGHELRRGALIVKTRNGEIDIDITRLIEDLGGSLRKHLDAGIKTAASTKEPSCKSR